jgi:hypothetical protein
MTVNLFWSIYSVIDRIFHTLSLLNANSFLWILNAVIEANSNPNPRPINIPSQVLSKSFPVPNPISAFPNINENVLQ